MLKVCPLATELRDPRTFRLSVGETVADAEAVGSVWTIARAQSDRYRIDGFSGAG
jgi:hypothetical protein